MIWLWVAPTEPTDSSTFASSSSIASANSFPSIPTLPIARASTPGNGPTPNAATNNRSTIISGRARSTPINVRAVERNHPGDKLRAPAKPKKNESSTPNGVATAASSTVTSAGPTISCNELQSGGKKKRSTSTPFANPGTNSARSTLQRRAETTTNPPSTIKTSSGLRRRSGRSGPADRGEPVVGKFTWLVSRADLGSLRRLARQKRWRTPPARAAAPAWAATPA